MIRKLDSKTADFNATLDALLAFESETDVPSTHLNAETDARNRPRQAEFYYDPSQHETYLDQLGIDYPQLEVPAPATN